MSAKIRVDGKVKLAANGISRFMTLWEDYELANGKAAKRKWIVWLPELLNFAEGTWVELEGDFSSMPSKAKDELGNYTAYQTYTDKNGVEVTIWDLIINNPVVLRIEEKNTNPNNIDLDDARKYGHSTYTQDADLNPF